MVLQVRFQSRVKEELAKRNWSQSQLAETMQVGRSFVSDYVSGRRSPGLKVIERFAVALEIDPADLLHETVSVN